MKTLLLLRHAKSGWDEPAVPDHDRPLTERGKKDAKRIGQLLQERGLTPDLIVSSTAKRARKTAVKLAKTSGFAGQVETTKRLYLADPRRFVDVLREVNDEHAAVLVVAHNPGLEELVTQLTGQAEHLPTAALAHVSLDIESWQDLSVASAGKLVQLWRPKELPGEASG